ncbi:MAG: hypothetical protein HY343_12560 [Lentisphaerae bacterium]|nr:hypothetical protein [Lentisphaerota bacterium]
MSDDSTSSFAKSPGQPTPKTTRKVVMPDAAGTNPPKPGSGVSGDTRPLGALPATPQIKKETSRFNLGAAPAVKTAVSSVKPLEPKRSTSPIALAAAMPGSPPQTIKLKRPPTSKLSVDNEASGLKLKTGRIGLGGSAPVEEGGKKRETMRIMLDETLPPVKPLEVKRATGPIGEVKRATGPVGELKRSTAPITLAAAVPGATPQTIKLRRPPTSQIIMAAPAETASFKIKTGKISGDSMVLAEAPGEGAQKRQTMRIMLDETLPPAEPSVVKRATGPIGEIKKATSRLAEASSVSLKRPPTSQITVPPSVTEVAPLKAKTGRITDEATRLAPPLAVAPGAMAGRPVAAMEAPPLSPKRETSRVAIIDDEGEEEPEVVKPLESKRQTSRIAIADVLSEEPPPGPAPKTIKLKRPPPSSAAVSLTADESEADTIKAARKGETSKIDLPLDEAAPAPITQRKTIKIKRPDRSAEPPTIALERPAGAATPGSLWRKKTGTAAGEEDDVGIVFPLVAAAAVLLAFCVTYLLAAQAFDPTFVLPVPSQLL